jgi:osmotically-inducible protein OsmY
MKSDNQLKADFQVAESAVAALRLNSQVPDGKVKVEVDDGWVTLTGEVDWAYQFASAEECIRPLSGVRALNNCITIKACVSGTNIADQIEAALKRQAEREANHIGVEFEGGVVTLQGRVHSLAEHDAAVGAALSTHGVSRVVDHLEIAA